MKLLLLYRRRWWLFYLPLLFCTAAALWWVAAQWRVQPPAKVLISAGTPQSGNARLAQQYAERLERQGLAVEIVYSDSQAGTLARLSQPTSADVALTQGIYAASYPFLEALAVVGQEPVWVFAPAGGISTLAQASGLRVAVGPAGSSTLLAAQAMLQNAGVSLTDIVSSPLTGFAAAHALLDGKLDLVFETGSEDSQAVQLLTRHGGVQLLGTENAGRLATQQPVLQPLLLPQGSIELRGDIPSKDLTLMSLQTHLVVRPDMHPALQRVLLDTATTIHEFPRFLERSGQFPAYRNSDFKLSETALSYSQGERPWVETLLPYGTAQWAELVFYAVLPILALALIVLAWIPRLFDWRINASLNNFYGELKFLESEMQQVVTDTPMKLRGMLENLDRIEHQVILMDLPSEYTERWYTLREHLAADRDRLLRLRAR